jgi:hypothetical protein
VRALFALSITLGEYALESFASSRWTHVDLSVGVVHVWRSATKTGATKTPALALMATGESGAWWARCLPDCPQCGDRKAAQSVAEAERLGAAVEDVVCGLLILDLLAHGFRSAGHNAQICQASGLGSRWLPSVTAPSLGPGGDRQ